MPHYPPLNEKSISQIKELYSQDEKYFDYPGCPYSETVKNLFKMDNPSYDYDDFDENEINDLTDTDNMIKEIGTLYKHLKEFGKEMRTSDTASERNTYYKLSASLLEKLITMKERVMDVKKAEEFTAFVIQIMEEELDVDVRSRILTKLKGALEE